MKVLLAVLAQSVAIDRFTNRLSLFNVFDTLNIPGLPALIPEAAFAAVFMREATDQDSSEADLIIKNGDLVTGKAQLLINFEGGPTNRNVVNFQPLPIMQAADLAFEVHFSNNEVFVISVPVAVTEPPPSGTEQVTTAEEKQKG